jgi:hypothetical protein
MSSSKKIDLYRDFAAGVYLAQNPIHTVDVYTLYIILIYTVKGGRGREMNQREG